MKNMVKFLFIAVIGMIMTLMSVVGSYASQITVCGDVWGQWSVDTVYVTCDIRIPPDSTLVIDSGVAVIFTNHCPLTVDTDATLIAIGDSTDTIFFTTNNPSNGWEGVRFTSASDSSRMKYCHLKHGLAIADGGGIYIFQSNPTIEYCLIDSCHANEEGGGIYIRHSSPIVSYCTILGNTSFDGGGMCIYGAGEAVISNNDIMNNIANDDGGGIGCFSNSDPILINNKINGNSASNGGGISCDISSPTITNNELVGNYASHNGGGIRCYNGSSPIISNNSFNSNQTQYGGGFCCSYGCVPILDQNAFFGNSALNGGGIYCERSCNPDIINNVIYNNSASHRGGGCYFGTASANFKNCTITGNTAVQEGGGIYSTSSNITLLNTILWDDSASAENEFGYVSGSYLDVSYCDIEGGLDGFDNIIDTDPWFRAPDSGDFHLQDSLMCSHLGDTLYSPCIDMGDPLLSDGFIDCLWGLGVVRSDIGAYGGGAGPPRITDITRDPSDPIQDEQCEVSATITDPYGAVSYANLYYDSSGSGYTTVSMGNIGDRYSGIIPGQDDQTQVGYYISAVDNQGDSTVTDTFSYYINLNPIITDIVRNPEFPSQNVACEVSAKIVDTLLTSSIVSANLHYDDGSGFTADSMNNTADSFYATIPGQPGETEVFYYITAKDNTGDSTISDTYSYTVLTMDTTLACYTVNYSDVVRAEGGFIEWQIAIMNTGSFVIDSVKARLTPMVNGCSGTSYPAWSSTSTIKTNFQPGQTFFGYYYMEVSGISNISLAACYFDIGIDVDDPLCTSCFNFHFNYQWGAPGEGEPYWPESEWYDKNEEELEIPSRINLYANYPNPFNATTTISFDIVQEGDVNLSVYNLTGQKVETLIESRMQAGQHSINWDASVYSSGVYFYKLTTGNKSFTKRMTLLK